MRSLWRITKPICCYLFVLYFLGSCSGGREQSSDPTVHKLVQGVVAAHGGEKALSRVKGYMAEGQLYATHRNVRIRTRRWFGRPDNLLLELNYPDQPEWRLTLGSMSWKGPDADHLSPASGPMIWSMRLQTARFDLPLRLLENEKDVVLLDPDEAGRAVLLHQLDDGLSLKYHIDPDTQRIVKMTMAMTGPPAMTFEADYINFKEVEGVFFPHGEVTRAGGTITSRVVLDKITINPANLSRKFMAPGSF